MDGTSLFFDWAGYALIAWPLLLVVHVLFSWAIWVIVRKRGLRCSGLAWLPVVNLWFLGSVWDQHAYVVNEKIQNRRFWVLGFVILETILLLLGLLQSPGEEKTILWATWATAVDLVSVGTLVFLTAALHGVYYSCNPTTAISYTLWSVLCPPLVLLFLHLDKNLEIGMPCRKGPYCLLPQFRGQPEHMMDDVEPVSEEPAKQEEVSEI